MWNSSKRSENTNNGMVITSFFAEGFKMIGDLESTCDIRVEGVIEGNISTTKKIVVGKTGQVIGNVKAANLCILGEFVGDAFVGELAKIESSGCVTGNLQSVSFHIEPGASVEATLKKISSERWEDISLEHLPYEVDKRSNSNLHLSVG
ncbi:MAG: polymer-forming cytoskeletal protein [Lunatimonas sp.]|uniref:bactofilin family protein n=1 Tax=Lunatimonas sp. TaxID=2060141 RepID=UPI00263A7748|nr:polymer-forming cytoskeletal protein [Lunatimonas sp.]MCC5939018.1 polymer-forming cytoskeletal protein [Lunatimonas sp.]